MKWPYDAIADWSLRSRARRRTAAIVLPMLALAAIAATSWLVFITGAALLGDLVAAIATAAYVLVYGSVVVFVMVPDATAVWRRRDPPDEPESPARAP